jgi:hypothetical protein
MYQNLFLPAAEGKIPFGLDFPSPLLERLQGGRSRLTEYNAQLNAAGLSLFHSFLRIAGKGTAVATIPALPMQASCYQQITFMSIAYVN